uniref:ribosomal protein L23 n=1 Tax=Caulacanthus ustulatus TaxID=31411 RepID=UPI0027DAB42E|nr:ribosomal protein L23 [Caulacanthus ustulatus]WCH57361.1 ribosomal protein L23 [Caulacanthus ustulatus]
MKKLEKPVLISLIKHPIITDKSTKLLEKNQYSFAVDRKANKANIKQAIEYIFNVQVKKINTSNTPIKKKRVGKFIGVTKRYKKAIVSLHKDNNINLFSDN